VGSSSECDFLAIVIGQLLSGAKILDVTRMWERMRKVYYLEAEPQEP